jgi:pilus assembly protein CpaB
MNAKITLIISIFLGMVTTFMFYSYIQKQQPAPVVQQEKLVKVIVAKEDLSKYTSLQAEFLEEMYVSEKVIHPNAIKNIEEAQSLITTATIAKGEIILKHHLQKVEDEQRYISIKLAEGYKAVSIGVNFVQSVSNLIEPLDFVDVIFTKEQDNGKISTEILLNKVKVLAVDRRMVEQKKGQEFMEYSAVTFELNSEDAVKVIKASQEGSIHLIVHSKVSTKSN